MMFLGVPLEGRGLPPHSAALRDLGMSFVYSSY